MLRGIVQRFRQWAEVPQDEPVSCDEIIIQGSQEQAKMFLEEQCRQAFADEPVNWSVEIIDGQVQVFFHSK